MNQPLNELNRISIKSQLLRIMDFVVFIRLFSLFDIEIATSFSYPAQIAQLICSSSDGTNGTNGSRFFLTRKKLSIRWDRMWEAVKAKREALSQKVGSLFRAKQAIGSFVSSIDVVLFSFMLYWLFRMIAFNSRW